MKNNSNDERFKKMSGKKFNRVNCEDEDTDYYGYSDISDTVSNCECAGMMYIPPQNEEENESYKDLFNMQIPKKKSSKKSNIQNDE
ncbi:MAG: hypothetical protein DBX47_01940 [Clostridiales bacterium]|nr:MAG: hypothetical protein DBX47_01940 [Clostridiales bacterium]